MSATRGWRYTERRRALGGLTTSLSSPSAISGAAAGAPGVSAALGLSGARRRTARAISATAFCCSSPTSFTLRATNEDSRPSAWFCAHANIGLATSEYAADRGADGRRGRDAAGGVSFPVRDATVRDARDAARPLGPPVARKDAAGRGSQEAGVVGEEARGDAPRGPRTAWAQARAPRGSAPRRRRRRRRTRA